MEKELEVQILVNQALSQNNMKLGEENARLREALKWALSGRVGLSSKELVACYFDMEAEAYNPLDKGDRGRCIGAIRAISGLESALEKIKSRPGWSEQVDLIKSEMKGGQG